MSTQKVSKQPVQGDYSSLLTEANVKNYNMIFPMLESILNEMKVLSSKKQDGILNNFKVKLINRLIGPARELLADEPTLEYLEEIEEDMLPQNSDVVLILCQYIEALEQFKRKNQVYIDGVHRWRTQENQYPSIKK